MEPLYSTILLVTQPIFLIPFLALGLFLIDRAIFAHTLIVFLFAMIASTFLKSLWQVPLPPHLGDGWAFPSGHMLTAAVLWGWLAWEMKKTWMTMLASVICTLIGISLVGMGYHIPSEVLASVGFAGIIISFYAGLHALMGTSPHAIGFGLATLGLVLIWALPKTFAHTWLALGGLVGFSIGNLLAGEQTLNRLSQRVFALTLALLGTAACYGLFSLIRLDEPLYSFLKFSLITFWVTAGVTWTKGAVCQT